MIKNADAISFVRNYLKYNAAKNYVAGISAAAINNIWRTINETEYSTTSYSFYCGNISIDTLRMAFQREMSYNPLRFDAVNLMGEAKYTSPVSDIVDSMRRVLDRFAARWPNGIVGRISISDINGPEYTFLRDLRACFKKIAMRNTADFKLPEYRDEIIARFATGNDISVYGDVRADLCKLAVESAARRAHVREIASLGAKISALQSQMNMHRGNDRAFCEEARAEMAQLKSRQDLLQRMLDNAKNASGRKKMTPVDIYGDDRMPANEAAEREQELLRTMTPEHNVDDIFAEYVERNVGIRLRTVSDEMQR